MLHQLDDSFPPDLASRTSIVWRDDFYAGGYAAVNDVTTNAVRTAGEYFDVRLETTYTGKAMAALLHDVQRRKGKMMFWNTYCANALPPGKTTTCNFDKLPPEFLRYFSATTSN
jgi:D-cysteine desulfhydrase